MGVYVVEYCIVLFGCYEIEFGYDDCVCVVELVLCYCVDQWVGQCVVLCECVGDDEY